MTNQGTMMTIGRYKDGGRGEQALWALLVVVSLIQIACAFGASATESGSAKPKLASVHMQDGTLLAKR